MDHSIEHGLVDYAEQLGIYCENISGRCSYWLIRTFGGQYYNTFKVRGFVGVGWGWEEELCKEQKVKPSDESYLPFLGKMKRGNAASKIKRFIENVQIGDVVLIPASKSSRVLMGRITSEVQFFDTEFPYPRRREVQWIKEIDWPQIPQAMSRFFLTHHGICSAESLAVEIDKLMYGFYQKDGKAYLSLNIRTDQDILARQVHKLLGIAIGLTEATQFDTRNVAIKTDLQSPGVMQFIGDIGPIFAFAVFLCFVVGGKVSGKVTLSNGDKSTTVEVKAETEGVVPQILDYCSQKKTETENIINALDIDTSQFIGKEEPSAFPFANASHKES